MGTGYRLCRVIGCRVAVGQGRIVCALHEAAATTSTKRSTLAVLDAGPDDCGERAAVDPEQLQQALDTIDAAIDAAVDELSQACAAARWN